MNKIVGILTITLLGLILTPTSIFAHSVVTPKEVGVATFRDFSLSVPSEKDASTISVRLILPQGLNFVSPVVKPGWKIEVKNGPIPSGITPPVASDGDVADSIPSEIDWTGGSIPSSQKDIFVFSAQVPPQPTDLNWKIYQTYSDGSVISWDQNPNETQAKDSKGQMDFSKMGPYSTTKVINDLKSTNTVVSGSNQNNTTSGSAQSNLPLILSVMALLLSGVCLVSRK